MKTRPIITVMLFAVCCLLFASPASAQLNQSGGSGSQLSSITLGGNALTARPTGELDVNLGRVAGNTISTGNGTAGAGVQRVTIASDNSPLSVKIDQTTPGTTNKVDIGSNGTVTINAIPAGANLIGIVKAVPSNPCGTTRFNPAWSAVPTTLTSVTGTTICLPVLVFNNTNATPQTVTVTDGAGSPITAIGPSFSIPGLSQARFELGGQLASGIKWQAGGTGVTGSADGWQ